MELQQQHSQRSLHVPCFPMGVSKHVESSLISDSIGTRAVHLDTGLSVTPSGPPSPRTLGEQTVYLFCLGPNQSTVDLQVHLG